MKISLFKTAFVFCLMVLAASCAQSTGQAERAYDPGEVSTTCASNLGLDGGVIMSLAAAFRQSNGQITEDFKEKASRDIAESENTQPSQDDPVFQQYISCLESYIAQ